ncbi:unnamed protein product [Symbiodinium sp. CCMP2592]|nr:unnamed protein product [Symbiodinium sp. CCMP2592]
MAMLLDCLSPPSFLLGGNSGERLFQAYVERTPTAVRALDILASRGGSIHNDHMALRSFVDSQGRSGREFFETIFTHFGYAVEDSLVIPGLCVNARWYEPPEETNWPKIFVSEMRINELPDTAAEILYRPGLKARLRTRSRRLAGLPERRSDLRRLGHHHATRAAFQASMGKRGDNGGWRNEHGKERSWSIWPGARSPQYPWRSKEERKGNQRGDAIPGYSSKEVSRGAVPPPHAPALPSEPKAPVGMVPMVQQALNLARKAEGKVAKLHADRDKREQQMKAWEADMKAAWLREKRLFATDMERINKEIATAVSAQDSAREHLQMVFMASMSGTEMPSTTMEVDGKEEEAQWEAARSEWDGVLQRALGTPARRSAPPMTPPTLVPYGAALWNPLGYARHSNRSRPQCLETVPWSRWAM